MVKSSAALSRLHKLGQVERFTERRDRCQIYVIPSYVDGRADRRVPTQREPSRRSSNCSPRSTRRFAVNDVRVARRIIFFAKERLVVTCCNMTDCPLPAYRRGWCVPHYTRWLRHGDPCAGRTQVGVPLESARLGGDAGHRRVHPTEVPDAKLPDHRRMAMYSVVCILAHGPRPPDRPLVAHSCRNGRNTFSCCNPAHVRWATYAENEHDKIDHGVSNRAERNGRAKLTAADVVEIRRLHAEGRKQQAIADEFGIRDSMAQSHRSPTELVVALMQYVVRPLHR